MSRKDYEAFAQVIAWHLNLNRFWELHYSSVEENDLEIFRKYHRDLLFSIAEDMATIFKRDNANFRKDKFFARCGFNENE